MNVETNLMAANGDRIQNPTGYVQVTLSRRNLLALLFKDEREGDAVRTLMRNDRGIILTIIAEPDETHYGDRKPGDMGADIEAKIADASHHERLEVERFEDEGGPAWPEED